METLKESSNNNNNNNNNHRKKSSKISMMGNLVNEVGGYLAKSCDGVEDSSPNQQQQHHKHRKLGVVALNEYSIEQTP